MQNVDDIIYLDHAAATPVSEPVLAAMLPFLSGRFFNPSSPYMPAFQVRQAYEQARADLAHAIGGKPAEVVITAGATESIALAFSVLNSIAGSATSALAGDVAEAPNDFSAPSGSKQAAGHVVATAIEHSAVLENARAHEHTLVGVNNNGLVDPEDVRAAIQPHTRLVSIGLANNEIGTIQPLREISHVVADVRQQRLADGDTTPIYLHSDASQAPGQIDVNTSTLGVDMLTLNSAKIYGPKQVGLLWSKSTVRLQPVLLGGGQERGLRSGTENVAGAVGFACALQEAVEHRKDEAKRLGTLRDMLRNQLLEAFPQAVVSGHKRRRLPNNLHIAFPGLDAERLVYLLEDRGVLVGTGAACAANKATRSHVLEAIGAAPEVADGSLRLTLGMLSTEENTARAAQAIIECVQAEYNRVLL